MDQGRSSIPPQHESAQPGHEAVMQPQPRVHGPYRGADKLLNKVALISGGDSGIGRATAAAFAKEGADCVLLYLDEHEDAAQTRTLVEEAGRRCLTWSGDIGSREFCRKAVEHAVAAFGTVDVLVNNAGEQHPVDDFLEITGEQLERTFRTNLFGYFYLTQAALPYMKAGSTIINTSSVAAYKGNPHLIDYAATKGAIIALTRSLSQALADRGIRVNAVAPGPIWTPLIPSTASSEGVAHFGQGVPLKRPGQPAEVAPCYVFLASEDSSYMTGQVLHPNGGIVING